MWAFCAHSAAGVRVEALWRAFRVLAISREVSGTSPRPPSRSPHEPDGLEDLEELGDDAIIAQQTAAHAPRPRANVSEESRSVVITDHPQRRDTEPPRHAPPRSTGEPTLVIRDRRALDELRHSIEQRKAKKSNGRRALYVWGALGLTAFVLGGVVAFLATESGSDATTADNQSALPGRTEAQIALPRVGAPAKNGSAASIKPSPSEPVPAVRLDDLPVERPSKR